jgi:hypothetical protein
MHVITRRALIAAAAIGGTALLAGCAAVPVVRVRTAPAADPGALRSFAFATPLGTDRAGYRTIVSQHLKAATQRELQARGFSLAAEAPQLLVDFHLQQQDRLRAVPAAMVGFGPHGWRHGWRHGLHGGWPWWFDATELRPHRVSTLRIDLVDAARRQTVWEAVVVEDVTARKPDELPAAIERAVTLAFERFPLPAAAPGAVPAAPAAPVPAR